MNSEQQPTLADYVVIALSPALIMTLVGSLVFFLVEVLYAGEYGARMRWILFCFVFGSVLVSRISMQTEIAERAGLYGMVLGLLVWIGLQTYVAYAPEGPLAGLGPFINAFLVLVTWWSAHRLTRDCTHIDDQDEASGEGLLHTAGLDEPAESPDGGPDSQLEVDVGRKNSRKSKTKEKQQVGGLLGWWDRYRDYQDAKKRRPHNPGVWVVYFSLAALPLYGLGQSLIPADDVERRRNAFWLMTVYVGSGLGLLLTTCFLGLRRYLRQRGLKMPVAMTGVWLTIGGAMVAAFLALGALLPRPYAEYTLFDSAKLFGTKERQASKYALSSNDAGKGPGNPASKRPPDQKSTGPGSQTRPGGQGRGRQSASGKSAQKGRSGADKQGNKQGNDGGDSGSGKASDGDNQGDNDSSGQSGREKQSGGRQADDGAGTNMTRQRSQELKMPELPQGLAKVVKWIVYVLAALAGLWLLLKFMANFTHWARRLLEGLRAFWLSLFGLGHKSDSGGGGEAEEARAPRPFSSFHNPFTHGSAGGMSPEELVRYSFEALEAFADERDLARAPEQTPLEFADRVGGELPALEADARRLAALYARAAYGRGRLPEPARESVRDFWQTLEQLHDRSLAPVDRSS